mmetsp:Transcript_1290/g.1591  ORF Transcript_1290/g.1591 Transcript_1290/m.1591 type:complete len:112 (-) Transcript_1290:4413-4748(-)
MVTQQRLCKEILDLITIKEDRNEVLIEHKFKSLAPWSAFTLVNKMAEHKVNILKFDHIDCIYNPALQEVKLAQASVSDQADANKSTDNKSPNDPQSRNKQSPLKLGSRKLN